VTSGLLRLESCAPGNRERRPSLWFFGFAESLNLFLHPYLYLALIRQQLHGIPGEGNGDSMGCRRQPAATSRNSR